MKLSELEKAIGYHFKEQALPKQAMSHSSYVHEKGLTHTDCNERLEFLGDAVLELLSSDYLYHTRPDMPEGALTKLRAALVCESALAEDARSIALEQQILLGKGEEQTGGRLRDSIVSDALEALIGALYLDGGIEAARDFVIRFVMNDIEEKQLFHDSKTILQELVQARAHENTDIVYSIIREEGPPHSRRFTAEVRIAGEVCGTGTGSSKKAAEQGAAYEAVRRYRQ